MRSLSANLPISQFKIFLVLLGDGITSFVLANKWRSIVDSEEVSTLLAPFLVAITFPRYNLPLRRGSDVKRVGLGNRGSRPGYGLCPKKYRLHFSNIGEYGMFFF